MPINTSTLSLIERCSFLQSGGCCETFEFGSASFGSSFGRLSSIGGVRLMIHTTLPRHSTSIFCPGSSFPMSTSIGAPAAFARSLGKSDMTNGVAVLTTPTPPTTLVAPTRKRRFPRSTVRSIRHDNSSPVPARHRGCAAHRQKPAPIRKLFDYTGFARPAGSLQCRPTVESRSKSSGCRLAAARVFEHAQRGTGRALAPPHPARISRRNNCL